MTTAAMQATADRAVEIEGERPSWNWCRWLAEAVNGIIALHRRLARGYRNLTTYRLPMLLAAGGLKT